MVYSNQQSESIPWSNLGFTLNFGVPSVYNANLTQKCIIGLVTIVFGLGFIRPS